MTKSTLLTGAGIAGAAMALAASQTKPVVMAEDTGPMFEAPEPPEDGATFPTVHGHLADVVRTVVANDDATFSADLNKGVIYPPEARAATEVMRGALRMYEIAAGAAANAPVPAMLRQALVKLDAALEKAGFTEGTVGAVRFKEVRTLVESGMLALDFQQPPATPVED